MYWLVAMQTCTLWKYVNTAAWENQSDAASTRCMVAGLVLDSISIVTLRLARLVPGRVTVFGRVNHLGAESQAPRPEPSLCAGWNEYPAKAGGVNRHIA